MKAEELKIVDVLTENKTYIIPPYQRPYSWNDEHAIRLIQDIYDSFDSNIKEYFIGSLICINKGIDDIYEVVDGQQRLTTLSLIMTKIRDLVSEQKVKDDLQKRVMPIDAYDENNIPKPRLKVRKKEEDLYVNYILQGKEDCKPINPTYTENLFIQNFSAIEDYLMDNLRNRLPAFAKYILNNVFIIFVQTNNFTSSYRMFNVLNTRGLSLQQSDLVKNRLLAISSENGGDVSQKIEGYWDDIENIISVENMDKFLTFYEISKKINRQRGVPKDRLEELLVNRMKTECNDNVTLFVLNLKKSATYYRKIKDGDFQDKKISRILKLLFDGNLSEWDLTPPILAYLNKYGEKNNFSEFIDVFEKCYLHCWFSGKYEGYREAFCYDTIANINTKQNFDQIKDGLVRSSSNDSLIKYFDDNVYLKNSRLIKYVLLRIDQEMQDDSVSKMYSGKITIEHILPKKMKDVYWTSRFSEADHQQWIHKIGNLTLISGQKNAQASNGDFNKKKIVYERNGKKVSFDIAKDVLQYKEWNLENLRKRHSFLLAKAKEIWFVDNTWQTSI